jgi:hypothetical protein
MAALYGPTAPDGDGRVRVEHGRLEISFGIARLPLEADALPRDAVRV